MPEGKDQREGSPTIDQFLFYAERSIKAGQECHLLEGDFGNKNACGTEGAQLTVGRAYPVPQPVLSIGVAGHLFGSARHLDRCARACPGHRNRHTNSLTVTPSSFATKISFSITALTSASRAIDANPGIRVESARIIQLPADNLGDLSLRDNARSVCDPYHIARKILGSPPFNQVGSMARRQFFATDVLTFNVFEQMQIASSDIPMTGHANRSN